MSGLGWIDIFDTEQETENMKKKTIRGTKTRVVRKPKQKAITLVGLQRQIVALNDTIEELNGNCSRHLRDAEKSKEARVNAEGERDEYKRQFDRVSTIIDFRLKTVFPNPQHDPYNEGSQVRREIPEEARVLGELLDIVQNVQLKRDYGDTHEMGVLRRGSHY